jgi:hypothetical protein
VAKPSMDLRRGASRLLSSTHSPASEPMNSAWEISFVASVALKSAVLSNERDDQNAMSVWRRLAA